MKLRYLLAGAVLAVGISSLSCEQQKKSEATPEKPQTQQAQETVKQEPESKPEQKMEQAKEETPQKQEEVKQEEKPQQAQSQEQPKQEEKASATVQIADAKELANKKGCFSCHDINTKKVGPAYIDVAKKYAGKEGAVEELVKSITKGSMGKWGSIPMAPQPVSQEEAKALAEWILSLK